MTGTNGAAPFRLSTARLPDTYRVTVGGELDLATTPTLTNELGRAVSSRSRHIDLDLEHVAFIDCAGVTALAKASDRAAARGKRLRITNASAPVRRTLDRTNLTGYLARRGTLEA